MDSIIQRLIERGYEENTIRDLMEYSDEEINEVSYGILKYLCKSCKRVTNPQIIYIGGQPGSGKSILSKQLKNNLGNYVEIGMDNFRRSHPKYLEIENYVRLHWQERAETENDSPGNDMEDFTHLFAVAMSDKITEMVIQQDKGGRRYNILMEWGMRDPTEPLRSMKLMKRNNYNVKVLFVVVNKNISYDACLIRANGGKNSDIYRKVPKRFHDKCVEMLPGSAKIIYEASKNENIIDYMALIERSGKIIWNLESDEDITYVYNEYLNRVISNDYNDPDKAIIGNEKEYLDEKIIVKKNLLKK